MLKNRQGSGLGELRHLVTVVSTKGTLPLLAFILTHGAAIHIVHISARFCVARHFDRHQDRNSCRLLGRLDDFWNCDLAEDLIFLRGANIGAVRQEDWRIGDE